MVGCRRLPNTLIFLGLVHIMNNKTLAYLLTPLLVAVISLLPAQISLCQAATVEKNLPVELSPDNKKVEVAKSLEETTSDKAGSEKGIDSDSSSMSTGMMVGLGVGAAVLLGGAIAIGSGGGGGNSAPDPEPVPDVPPTAAELVAPWHVEGHQPGSGLTYTGTYHLYDGGSLGYDLQISNGQHLVGGGRWSINGYNLQMQTDHSRYSGDFVPGNITTIHMNSNTGWDTTMTR